MRRVFPRCAALNKKREGCKFYAVDASGLCRVHGDPKRRAALAVISARGLAVRAAKPIRKGFADYATDPVGFAHDVLGVELWSHQRRALEAIAQHRRVAWRSCHGIGKTETAACAALWHTLAFPGALTIVTAPTSRQVRSVFWRAVKRLHRKARVPLGGVLHDQPESGLVYDDGRVLLGLSAGDGERFAGLHAPSVLLIVDESSGVPQSIFEAAKGSLTSGGRILLTGNPTRTSGEFFDAFHSKAALWHCLHTSASDSPNIAGTEPAVSGLIDQQWVDDLTADYGEGSAVLSVRVGGDFPSQAADAVISLALVEQAKEAWHAFMADGGRRKFPTIGPLEIGVDVARFGDDLSCVVVRRGLVVLEPQTFAKHDAVRLAEQVRRIATDHANPGERPIVRVDTCGVGGGCADILRKDRTLRVVDVNASSSATSDTHMRMRDSLWFGVRDFLKAGGCLPPDQKLEAELLAPTYAFSPSGKLVVESKDDTRVRLRRSPDRADALALAVHSITAQVGITPTTLTRGCFARRLETGPTDTWGRRIAA